MNMKNKTLAIFGIITYILSVLSSALDLEGNSVAPIALIVVSGIATAVFIIMATIRLWKISRNSSILLASSTIILFILSFGSPPIILFNIIRAIQFISFIWAICLLWAMGKQEGLTKKT